MTRFEPTTCCECGATLTEEEIKEFWNGPYCCTGYNCGCRGLPIDPPCCFKCMEGDNTNGERLNEGHGNEILRDDNDPHFAVCGIKDVNGRVVFECDEVTK